MSGGSLNYVYGRVEDAAREVLRRAETPLHRAFGSHLLKVSAALHDLEWVLSCDYGPGDEVAAIRAVVSPQDEIDAAIGRAQESLHELQALLNVAMKTRNEHQDSANAARKTMKLFVWEDVLSDYTSGMMVAIAPDVETARAQLLKKRGCIPEDDLNKQPKEIDWSVPDAFVCWGGG